MRLCVLVQLFPEFVDFAFWMLAYSSAWCVDCGFWFVVLVYVGCDCGFVFCCFGLVVGLRLVFVVFA